MTAATKQVEELIQQEYRAGFVTDIESDTVAPGLNEDVIRLISAKKNEPEFMLDWRLRAYRYWTGLHEEPHWAHLHHSPIDYQAISYYSAPKSGESPRSGAEIPGVGGALHGQSLCHAELGGVFGRLIRLCTEGRTLSDGAFHLFQDQRHQHGPV